MERKNLTIADRNDVENGRYFVETRDGRQVRIICWDRNSIDPIVGLITNPPYNNIDSVEILGTFTANGESSFGTIDCDLFLVENAKD